MAPEANPVQINLGNITVNAYQLAEDDLCRLLLTHRQIGEPIGKTKASAQKFCKEHEQELPSTVTAVVPDKPRPVALSSWSARGRGQGEGSRGETPYLKAGAQNL